MDTVGLLVQGHLVSCERANRMELCLRPDPNNCIQTPAELPYFEGDFWPNVMEENIRELEQEEEVRKRVSKRQCFLFLGSYFP